MKTITPLAIIITITMVFILTGCESEKKEEAPKQPESAPVMVENICVTNNDCVRTGCSGIICQSNKQEPVFTTCEFLPEYECYNEVPCGCFQGSCQWSDAPPYEGVLEKCLAEKQSQPAEPIVDEQGVPIV